MKKIIVIEDDEMGYDTFVSLLQDVLPTDTYEIIEVGISNSVSEAMQKITNNKPDIILLDMNLGHDVLEPEEASVSDGGKILSQINLAEHTIICISSSSQEYKPFLREAGFFIHHPEKWWNDLDAITNCVKEECNCF